MTRPSDAPGPFGACLLLPFVLPLLSLLIGVGWWICVCDNNANLGPFGDAEGGAYWLAFNHWGGFVRASLWGARVLWLPLGLVFTAECYLGSKAAVVVAWMALIGLGVAAWLTPSGYFMHPPLIKMKSNMLTLWDKSNRQYWDFVWGEIDEVQFYAWERIEHLANGGRSLGTDGHYEIVVKTKGSPTTPETPKAEKRIVTDWGVGVFHGDGKSPSADMWLRTIQRVAPHVTLSRRLVRSDVYRNKTNERDETHYLYAPPLDNAKKMGQGPGKGMP